MRTDKFDELIPFHFRLVWRKTLKMLAIDTDGSIIYANQRIEQLLQLPIQDLIGSDIEAYIALESIDGFRKMVRDAIEAKTPTAEHKASVDTDSSENAAPVAKRAKFSDDQAVASESKPIEVYTANVNTHQGEAEANLPTQKIQRHLGFGSTKQISTSATSSSPTGGTSSSPTERNQSMNSSSMQSSPSDKSKATNNSSESGYGASSSLGNISSRSDASDAVKGSAQKKTVQLNVALPPTLVICLLRKDNSKVWCEMTISARVKSFSDSISSDSSSKQSDKTGDMLELLLCFRPVTQGLSDSSDLTSSSNSRENGSRGSKGSNGTNGSQKDA